MTARARGSRDRPATSCAGCFAWGVLGGRNCGACSGFAHLHDTGQCKACERVVAVREGYCRLCWAQASYEAKHRQVKYLQPVLEGIAHHQLFFTGMRRLRRPSSRSRDRRYTATPPAAPRLPVAAGVQPRMLDVPKDFSRFDKRLHADLTNPWVIRARRATRRLGEAHGWSRWTQFEVNRALVMLLSGHAEGDTIYYSELFPAVRGHGMNVKRTIEVLDDIGVFEDDRVPALDSWLDRQLAGLAPGIRSDVEAWAHALVDGGPRSRPRDECTLRGYLHQIRPVLTDWSQRYDQLREVTRDDVVAVRDARQGATREFTIVGLRSLFRFAKTTGRVFRDPTSGVQTTRGARRVPLPLRPVEIDQAVQAAVTPAARVILALAGIHAARTSEIRRLLLDDVDLANRRLVVGGWVRPLDEPTRQILLTWLNHRRNRWPNTANPHLLVNPNTALGLRPVGKVWVAETVRGLTANVERLRVDRQLDEALTHGADPLHLAAVFGLEEGTAIRYAEAARQLLEGAAEQHTTTGSSRTQGSTTPNRTDQPSGSG
jgi:hypothetical protein